MYCHSINQIAEVINFLETQNWMGEPLPSLYSNFFVPSVSLSLASLLEGACYSYFE